MNPNYCSASLTLFLATSSCLLGIKLNKLQSPDDQIDNKLHFLDKLCSLSIPLIISYKSKGALMCLASQQLIQKESETGN